MKLLTLNFLTCATRACKSQISATTTSTTTATSTSSHVEPALSASADAGDTTATTTTDDGKEGGELAGDKVSARGAPFPLHVRDAEIERVELAFNPLFLRNILSRIEWTAMHAVVNEVGLQMPDAPSTVTGDATTGLVAEDVGGDGEGMAIDTDKDTAPASSTAATTAIDGHGDEDESRQGQPRDVNNDYDDEYLKQLHEILIETNIQTGKLVCGRCGHEYAIREGIANFLLPPHLV